MAERHHRNGERKIRIVHLVTAAALCWTSLLCTAGPVTAQTASLEQLSDWYLTELEWRARGGLPGGGDFVAPLTAHYNWAYGMTALGLNVRGTGEADYYAAFVLHQDGLMESLDEIGPLTGPAQWDAGPYYIAAGLPDGRIIVWLNAPGQNPQRFRFTDAYVPYTAIDFTVYPPNPISASWKDWWVTGAYQYNSIDQSLLVANANGLGEPLGYFEALGLAGNLTGVSYYDYPAGDRSVAYVVYTIVRDRVFELGNNQHTATLAAYYKPGAGWYTQVLRNSGLYNGEVFVGWDGAGVTGLIACDESDTSSASGILQRLSTFAADGPRIDTSLAGFSYLPYPTSPDNFHFFSSTRSSYPLIAFSDGISIKLGYHAAQSGLQGGAARYNTFQLYTGNSYEQDGTTVPADPITAVAAAAHWSTGDPEVFFIHGGSASYPYGRLFRLSYEPPRR